ncbi:hypothetical protein C2E23DRAFT_840793 [Lenzites betulinus]|nr:hypothetical protein C2E23DRAFT_840733 [Lenzites betulinus]KAH9849091.1 hypothetical protein C2E23DRAFT_840763 [Lenzites betulinus]KAH9849095.1 hypothetical protein C2E23DRAFT_840793 [Lenzites betulinus]
MGSSTWYLIKLERALALLIQIFDVFCSCVVFFQNPQLRVSGRALETAWPGALARAGAVDKSPREREVEGRRRRDRREGEGEPREDEFRAAGGSSAQAPRTEAGGGGRSSRRKRTSQTADLLYAGSFCKGSARRCRHAGRGGGGAVDPGGGWDLGRRGRYGTMGALRHMSMHAWYVLRRPWFRPCGFYCAAGDSIGIGGNSVLELCFGFQRSSEEKLDGRGFPEDFLGPIINHCSYSHSPTSVGPLLAP